MHPLTRSAHESGTRLALVGLEKSCRQWFVWQATSAGGQEARPARRRRQHGNWWPFNGSIVVWGGRAGRIVPPCPPSPPEECPELSNFCPIHCLAQSQQRRRTSPQNVTRQVDVVLPADGTANQTSTGSHQLLSCKPPSPFDWPSAIELASEVLVCCSLEISFPPGDIRRDGARITDELLS